MRCMKAILVKTAATALALVSAAEARAAGVADDVRCISLAADKADGIDHAVFRPLANATPAGPFQPPNPPNLMIPAHCEIHGMLDARTGIDGQHYAIHYHLRLPTTWNGRFFFQGGGGTNGVVGDAYGPVGGGRVPAIAMGYAVVSQDSGHDNQRNNDPERAGVAVFGGDPVARANYGGTSLKRVADTAKKVVVRFYSRPIEKSYFFGCSKGGEEGMVFAQRYPSEFDGIVAAAPGFALPRAAVAQVWDVQVFGALTRTRGDAHGEFRKLASVFSDAQLALVRDAVLAACDGDDGAKDGIVGRFDRCTLGRVKPELDRRLCASGQSQPCLSPAQEAALIHSMDGPRDAAGKPIYSDWAWDGGVGSFGWRMWKLGSDMMPALNVSTGGASISMIFTVPPTPIRDDPNSYFGREMELDISREASKIYATNAQFPRSAWTDVSAHSANLSAFRTHGGKLIVPHGASDPVFSINDTLAWYRRARAKEGPLLDSFLRVFAVPGMNHCGMGPATDNYDAFAALVAWVEKGQAPDRIIATAGPASPWPGRTRPLCPYPKVAVYTGHGSIEDAANFTCRT